MSFRLLRCVYVVTSKQKRKLIQKRRYLKLNQPSCPYHPPRPIGVLNCSLVVLHGDVIFVFMQCVLEKCYSSSVPAGVPEVASTNAVQVRLSSRTSHKSSSAPKSFTGSGFYERGPSTTLQPDQPQLLFYSELIHRKCLKSVPL